MPWEWAMPHMIAGVTAAPRWQWSSASGVVLGSDRVILVEDSEADERLERELYRFCPGLCRRGRRRHVGAVDHGEPVAQLGDLAPDGLDLRLAQVRAATIQ